MQRLSIARVKNKKGAAKAMKYVGYLAATHNGFINGFIELIKKLNQEQVISADMNKYNWTIVTPNATYCGVAYEDIQGAVDPVKYFPFTRPSAIMLSPLIGEKVYETIVDRYDDIPVGIWMIAQGKTLDANKFYVAKEQNRID